MDTGIALAKLKEAHDSGAKVRIEGDPRFLRKLRATCSEHYGFDPFLGDADGNAAYVDGVRSNGTALYWPPPDGPPSNVGGAAIPE